MEEILVSVVIPSYNCQHYLGKAIRSVLKQQVPLELIIVDDASTDRTADMMSVICKKFPDIIYIRLDYNCGVAAARNIGIARARGRYIAFLDADDWWAADKLKKQLKLIQNRGCVLTYSARELRSTNGNLLKPKIGVPEKLTYCRLLHTNVISCSSVLIETKAAKAIPMEHDEIHEDYLAWLRILKQYGTAYGINEPLLISRMTKGGKSRNKWRTFYMTYGVYRHLGMGKARAAIYTGRHVVNSILRYL